MRENDGVVKHCGRSIGSRLCVTVVGKNMMFQRSLCYYSSELRNVLSIQVPTLLRDFLG